MPYPDNLVVNLKMCKELIKDLLGQLPKRFETQHDPYSSLGAALQAGYKLLVCILFVHQRKALTEFLLLFLFFDHF